MRCRLLQVRSYVPGRGGRPPCTPPSFTSTIPVTALLIHRAEAIEGLKRLPHRQRVGAARGQERRTGRRFHFVFAAPLSQQQHQQRRSIAHTTGPASADAAPLPPTSMRAVAATHLVASPSSSQVASSLLSSTSSSSVATEAAPTPGGMARRRGPAKRVSLRPHAPDDNATRAAASLEEDAENREQGKSIVDNEHRGLRNRSMIARGAHGLATGDTGTETVPITRKRKVSDEGAAVSEGDAAVSPSATSTPRERERLSEQRRRRGSTLRHPITEYCPHPPTRDDATAESICSYLLSLRRLFSSSHSGRRSALRVRRLTQYFLSDVLPQLLRPPHLSSSSPPPPPPLPTEETMEGSEAEAGMRNAVRRPEARATAFTAPLADPELVPPHHPTEDSLTPSPVSATVTGREEHMCTGKVPWSIELAEAVLLTCARLDLNFNVLSIVQTASLYLDGHTGVEILDNAGVLPSSIHNDGNGTAAIAAARVTAHANRLTRMPLDVVQEKAQLAISLLHLVETSRRQGQVYRDQVYPQAKRLAAQLRLGHWWGDAEADATNQRRNKSSSGEGGYTVSTQTAGNAQATATPKMTGRQSHFMSREEIAQCCVRYLSETLLPLLFHEFANFCEEIQKRYDEKARRRLSELATVALTPPSNIDCDMNADPQVTSAAVSAHPSRPKATPWPTSDAEGNPPSRAAQHRQCLPKLSRRDVEVFSTLTSVLHKAVAAHGVVRVRDALHFDLTDSPETDASMRAALKIAGCTSEYTGRRKERWRLPHAEAASAQRLDTSSAFSSSSSSSPSPLSCAMGAAARSAEVPLVRVRRCPALSRHSFCLAMEAVAASLDDAAGPSTDALAMTFSRFRANQNRMEDTHGGHESSLDFSLAALEAVYGVGDPSLAAADAAAHSVSAYGVSARVKNPATPRVIRGSSSALSSPPTRGQELPHRGPGRRPAPSQHPCALTKDFGNFNLETLLVLLRFAFHEHSYELFLSRAAPPLGGRDATNADVEALAYAMAELLLLAIHWSPLSRSYQLRTLLGIFARVVTTIRSPTTSPRHTGGDASSCSSSKEGSFSCSAAKSVPAVSMDLLVQRRVAQFLLPPETDAATCVMRRIRWLHRLLLSAARYQQRFDPVMLAAMAASAERALQPWLRPTDRSSCYLPPGDASVTAVLALQQSTSEGSSRDEPACRGGTAQRLRHEAVTASSASAGSGAHATTADPSTLSSSVSTATSTTTTSTTTPAAAAAKTTTTAAGGTVGFSTSVSAVMPTVQVLSALMGSTISLWHGRLLWRGLSSTRQAQGWLAEMKTSTHRKSHEKGGVIQDDDGHDGADEGDGGTACFSSMVDTTFVLPSHSAVVRRGPLLLHVHLNHVDPATIARARQGDGTTGALRLSPTPPVPGVALGTTQAATAQTVDDVTLRVPRSVLRSLALEVGHDEQGIAVEAMMSLCQTHARTAEFQAVPSGCGDVQALRHVLRTLIVNEEALCSFSTADTMALATRSLLLEMTAATLPDVMMMMGGLDATLEHKGGTHYRGRPEAQQQGRLFASALPFEVMRNLWARIEPMMLKLCNPRSETFAAPVAGSAQSLTSAGKNATPDIGGGQRYEGDAGRLSLSSFVLCRTYEDGRLIDPLPLLDVEPLLPVAPTSVRGERDAKGSPEGGWPPSLPPHWGESSANLNEALESASLGIAGPPICRPSLSMYALLWCTTDPSTSAAYPPMLDGPWRASVEEVTTLLRTMTLLLEVERSGFNSSDGATERSVLSLHVFETILRIAYRVLFYPASHPTPSDEQRSPPSYRETPSAAALPLETLVTLHLALRRASCHGDAPKDDIVTDRAEAAVGEVGVHADGSIGHESCSCTSHVPRSTVKSRAQAAVRCCLLHCEERLRSRLTAVLSEREGRGAAVVPTTESGANTSLPQRKDMKTETVSTNFSTLLQLAILAEEIASFSITTTITTSGGGGGGSGASLAATAPSVAQLVQDVLLGELRVVLQTTALQRIAGDVSQLLWWVTRRVHVEAKDASSSSLCWPPSSQVEQLLLDAIEEKVSVVQPVHPTSTQRPGRRLSKRRCKAPSECTSSAPSGAAHQRFELYEWALLPFYTKIVLRHRNMRVTSAAAAVAATPVVSSSPAAVPARVRPVLDDFTALEDTYGDETTFSTAGYAPSPTPLHTTVADGAANHRRECSTSGSTAVASEVALHDTLEAALQALPTQCTTFPTLLHIIRQIFLAHPVLLSTTPEAPHYFAAGWYAALGSASASSVAPPSSTPLKHRGDTATLRLGRQAWASLPVHRVDVAVSLRERYVNVLSRQVERLVHHDSCTMEGLVELLHLTWLADPQASRLAPPLLSPLASSGRWSASLSSSTPRRSEWTSVYERSSTFVRSALETAAEQDTGAAATGSSLFSSLREDSSGAAGGQASSPSPATGHLDRPPQHTAGTAPSPVPKILYVLHRALHHGIFQAVKLDRSHGHWRTISALTLRPEAVLTFLHGFCNMRRLEARRDGAAAEALRHRRLSSPARAAAVDGAVEAGHLPPPPLQNFRAYTVSRPLTAAQAGALGCFEPFLLHACSSANQLTQEPKSLFLPRVLELLSEIDASLMLLVVRTCFSTGATVRSSGKGDDASRRQPRQRQPRKAYRDRTDTIPNSTPRFGKSLGKTLAVAHLSFADTQQVCASAVALLSALVMVAQQAAHPSPDGSISPSLAYAPSSSSPTTRAQPRRAHRRAVGYLRVVVLQMLRTVNRVSPFHYATPSLIMQLLQPPATEEDSKLFIMLSWHALSMMLPARREVRDQLLAAAGHRRRTQAGAGFTKGGASAMLTRDATSPDTTAATDNSDALYQRRFRFALTDVGLKLLSLMPLNLWQSLLWRMITWAPYRTYSYSLLRVRQKERVKRKRQQGALQIPANSLVRQADEFYDHMRNSLMAILLRLDEPSLSRLIAHLHGPTLLLWITVDIIRYLAWCNVAYHDSDGDDRVKRYRVEGRRGGQTDRGAFSGTHKAGEHIMRETAAATAPVSPSLSYDAVLRYASPGSVLTEVVIQPWLRAACGVIDRLAGADLTEFVAVLEEEAAWQRRVTNASTLRGSGEEEEEDDSERPGKLHLRATEVRVSTAADAAAKSVREALEHSALVDEDITGVERRKQGPAGRGVEEERLLRGVSFGASEAGSGGSVDPTEAVEAAEASVIQDAVASPSVLVLDWRPIVEFIKALREADPGMTSRQIRSEWGPSPLPTALCSQPAERCGEAAEVRVSEPHRQDRPGLSSGGAGLSRSVSLDAPDVLHNAVEDILYNVRTWWQMQDEAPQPSPSGSPVPWDSCNISTTTAPVPLPRPLLVKHACDVLHLFTEVDRQLDGTPDTRSVGGNSEGSYRGVATDEWQADAISPEGLNVVVDPLWWLKGSGRSSMTSSVAGEGNKGAYLIYHHHRLTTFSCRCRPTARPGGEVAVAQQRRVLLLLRAGVLTSAARTMALRSASFSAGGKLPKDLGSSSCETSASSSSLLSQGTMAAATAAAAAVTGTMYNRAVRRSFADGYSRQAQRIREALLCSLFGMPAATSSSAVGSGKGAPAALHIDDGAAALERRARRRLQLLRCDDLARLLPLLMAPMPLPRTMIDHDGDSRAAERTAPLLASPRQLLQARVVISTLSELLPSASSPEVLQVVRTLLPLALAPTTRGWVETKNTNTAGDDPGRLEVALHHEIRRLLASTAVLLANDVDRFTNADIVWLLSRLHTPLVRVATGGRDTLALAPEGITAHQSRKTESAVAQLEGPLDVSLSYVSAAVACAVRHALTQSADGTSSDRQDDGDMVMGDVEGTSAAAAFGEGRPDHLGQEEVLSEVALHMAPTNAPVTVKQWVLAVKIAEDNPDRVGAVELMLRLIERSAV